MSAYRVKSPVCSHLQIRFVFERVCFLRLDVACYCIEPVINRILYNSYRESFIYLVCFSLLKPNLTSSMDLQRLIKCNVSLTCFTQTPWGALRVCRGRHVKVILGTILKKKNRKNTTVCMFIHFPSYRRGWGMTRDEIRKRSILFMHSSLLPLPSRPPLPFSLSLSLSLSPSLHRLSFYSPLSFFSHSFPPLSVTQRVRVSLPLYELISVHLLYQPRAPRSGSNHGKAWYKTAFIVPTGDSHCKLDARKRCTTHNSIALRRTACLVFRMQKRAEVNIVYRRHPKTV